MTNKQAEISIVVPVYNRAKLVLRTLQSIERQTLRPLDVVLVDNNSADDSLKVLMDWASQHNSQDFKVKVLCETKAGAAAARNKGLSAVDTKYVMFFDSDDTMQPTLAQQYVEEFDKNQDVKIVYTGAIFHNLNGASRKAKLCRHRLLRKHIYHAILRTQGYAVQTEWFREVGAWNEEMLGWDDLELGVRLLINDPKIVCIPGTPVDIYLQQESITGTDFASRPHLWENALDEIDKVIDASSRKDKASLHRLIDYRRIVLAAHYAKEGADTQAVRLYDSVMIDKQQTRRMRILMPLAYSYIKHGGRGAASILDLIL